MTETHSLAQRHASYQTPEAIIFALVKEHTGCTGRRCSKIVKGYDSEVYDVATQEGMAFIVKIRHAGEVTYEQERWAMEQCRALEVPVARIPAIGRREITGTWRDYMI